MKIVLRFVISGLVVALVAVLCIFVFFKPNNAVDAYNTLSSAFGEKGAIVTMEDVITDTVKKKGQKPEQITSIFPNYRIVQSELSTLEDNYSKMLLYDNKSDASETLKRKAKEYISTVDKFNEGLENYKRAVESDASSASIAEIESRLNDEMSEQISILSDLNVLVFECLRDGFYDHCYSYDVAIRAIASIYSDKIGTGDVTLAGYLVLLDEATANHTESFEGANKFLYYVWDLDLKKLFDDRNNYLVAIKNDEVATAKANYALAYIDNLIEGGK